MYSSLGRNENRTLCAIEEKIVQLWLGVDEKQIETMSNKSAEGVTLHINRFSLGLIVAHSIE